MIKSTLKLEEKLINEGYDFVVGVDEAGRGPLAGPVVACACSLKSSSPLGRGVRGEGREKGTRADLIRDSKTLSEKQRESLFDFIHENFHVGVGICDHKTIDRINILEASFMAMKKAIQDLKKKIKFPHPMTPSPLGRGWVERERNPGEGGVKYKKIIILVDGNKKIPNFSMEQQAIVSGDKLVKSISAASIIAKVTRDRIMREMDKKYPEYQFAKHKGYGTKLHMEMLTEYRPCEIHRRTFAPVNKLLKNQRILAKRPV